MSSITIEDILINENRISYPLSVEGDIKKYFDETELYVEYDRDISEVPRGVLSIPPVSAYCTLAWVTGASFNVPSLDTRAKKSLYDVKNGYEQLLPNLELDGEINVNNTVSPRSYEPTGYSMLFTGGVDSTATYLRNREVNPTLIGVEHDKMGSEDAWEYRKKYTDSFAQSEGVSTSFISSNLKSVLDRRLIDLDYQNKIGRSWWGAMQYGIALMGICAPLTYSQKIGVIFQGSGYTMDPKYPTAQPYIVNPFQWTETECQIDAADLTRQDKIQLITSEIDSLELIKLDSCVDLGDEGVCCSCRKCYRTIMGLLAAGTDPTRAGFNVNQSITNDIQSAFESGEIQLGEIGTAIWTDIQESITTTDYPYENIEFVEWFSDFDLNEVSKSKHESIKRKIWRELPFPIDIATYRIYRYLR